MVDEYKNRKKIIIQKKEKKIEIEVLHVSCEMNENKIKILICISRLNLARWTFYHVHVEYKWYVYLFGWIIYKSVSHLSLLNFRLFRNVFFFVVCLAKFKVIDVKYSVDVCNSITIDRRDKHEFFFKHSKINKHHLKKKRRRKERKGHRQSSAKYFSEIAR